MSKTVLIVDDEPDIRTSLELLLAGEGFRVVTAGDGREALDVLHERQPDVVVLDLMMPVMNGWQVLQAMRQDAWLARVPVIVVSAVTSNRFYTDVTWLKKPVDVDLFLRTIQATLAAPERVLQSA